MMQELKNVLTASQGELQEKAMALWLVKLNDWMEKEIVRLNQVRDIAEEREHRLHAMPIVRSDPKMNPEYESSNIEEYFNMEHGDHMESKYFEDNSNNLRPLKREPEN
nr:hypothetical protein [Tanacetum cinerariifolium]